MKDKGLSRYRSQSRLWLRCSMSPRNTIYHYLRDIQDAHETDEVLEE